MKIRTGKIARLPFVVRNELNRRIENGEPGTKLVPWLNKRPEVREVLREHFGGREITEQNLSDWVAGGYQDWVALKRLEDEAHQLAEDTGVLAHTVGALPGNLATVLSIRYASLMMEWDGEVTEEFERKVRGLERLRHSVSALQRGFLKHWEVDLESQRHAEAVKREILKRHSEEATNLSMKEMMTKSVEAWNRDNPDDQRDYSFLHRGTTFFSGKRRPKANAKQRPSSGAKKDIKPRMDTDGHGFQGGIQQTAGVEQLKEDAGKEEPRTLDVEPLKTEGDECRVAGDGGKPKEVEGMKGLSVEEVGKEKEKDEMQSAERSDPRSEPVAEAKAETEKTKQPLVEETKPQEMAEEGKAPQMSDVEAYVLAEKKKVRVDAIITPRRWSRHWRGLEG